MPRRAQGPVYAAIDLGTNNCRLLIARPTRSGFVVVDAFSRIVRLGEGLIQTGRLSEEAMERAISALGVCARKIRRRGVTRARHVATQACRFASNGAEFLGRVAEETGLEFDIIDAEEEAKLAASGCLPLIDPQIGRALIFDIGGGSTELVYLERQADRRFEIRNWISLHTGVVTLAEHHGGRNMRAERYDAMTAEVMPLIAPFQARIDIARGPIQFLGTSGTVTTLAGVHLKLARYDRNVVDGCWIETEAAERISRELAAMSWEERAAHPCIGAERADLVVAGCAILSAITTSFGVSRMRVADRGLREGILNALMDADRAQRAIFVPANAGAEAGPPGGASAIDARAGGAPIDRDPRFRGDDGQR